MAYLGGETREQSASSRGDESHARYQGPIARLARAPGCPDRDNGRSAYYGGGSQHPAGGIVALHHTLTVGNGDTGANHAEVKGGDTGQSSAVEGTVQVSEP